MTGTARLPRKASHIPTLHQEAAAAEAQHGQGSVQTAAALLKLSEALAAEQDYQTAVPLCLTAMQTYKSLHGAVHEDTLAACRALGITLEMMGAYDNAASLFQEAFDGCQELYGAGHAATVNAQHDLGMNQLKVSGHLRVVRCCI